MIFQRILYIFSHCKLHPQGDVFLLYSSYEILHLQGDIAMKNIKIEFTNERIIPASGLAVVGAILGKSDFVKRCNRMDVTPNRSQHQIKNGDILLTYIGLLCMGKPAYQAVHEMDDDPDFYKYALGITRSIPSEETLRQRMDDIGSSLRDRILAENVELLRTNGIVPSKLPNGYVPVDIDVTPFDNSKTCKEGVSRTYKGYDGYAPIMAYIGTEGYWSMPNFGKENSIVSVTRLHFSEKPLKCAVRSQMNHSSSVLIPEMMRLKISGSCWRAAVTSL